MEDNALPISFGEWVKHRRKELDMTQADLARSMGYSTPALRKIEAGQRRPSKQLAEVLARSLEIPNEEQPAFIRAARGELSPERLHSPGFSHSSSDLTETEQSPGRINFPIQLTPLFGREAELAALADLLKNPNCRLLTITGIGGVGKTRLAIEVASQHNNLFSGGTYYVPLGSLNSAEFIVPAIAEVFKLSVSGAIDPQEKLINFLSARSKGDILLVLDNLEHLLVLSDFEDKKFDIALFLTKLLQELPNLKILVTSLVHVNIQGEWTFDVHGLPFPTSDRASQVETFSATALFLQHARQVKTDFILSPDDMPALARICQMVEGNPLAIELAAAWVGLFSINDIAQELESDLDFLKTSMRDIPERHRSLRAALDHSWRLLTTDEQQGLCHLAVFRGGFQREAAEKVAGTSPQILMSLHSKSLLYHREDGRFDLNEIVRRYALFHLVDDPSYRETRELHIEYFLGLALNLEKALNGLSQPTAVQTVLNDIDNIRAAMAWGVENHQAERSLQIAIALGQFWDTQGYWNEGLEWLERGLCSKANISALLRAKALTVSGILCRNLADYPKSINMLQESARLWRDTNDTTGLALTLCQLGSSQLHQGEMANAEETLENALSLSKQNSFPFGIYFSLGNLGYSASRQGNPKKAIKLYSDALVLAQEAEDENQIADLLNKLGNEYVVIEDYTQAEEYYRLASAIYQKRGHLVSLPYISCSRGYIAIKQGKYSLASDLLTKSLLELNELGDKEYVFKCLGYLALLANVQHLANRTIRLLGAIDTLIKATGIAYEPTMQKNYNECLASVRANVSEPAFNTSWAQGSKMTFDEVISFSANGSKSVLPHAMEFSTYNESKRQA